MNFKQFCENITEEEYRASPRRSYSFFKEFSEYGPKAIISPKEALESVGLTRGSIVDKMLSDASYLPTDEYLVSDDVLDLSGDTHSSKIVKYIYANGIFLNRDDPKSIDYLNGICETLEMKRFPKFDDSLWSQIELVKLKLNDAKLTTSDELQIAYDMFNTLTTHEFTKNIFNPELDIEVLVQAPIYFDVDDVECKSLLDRILINHSTKRIFPYDVKTGTKKDFMTNFYTYKYYYQGGLYRFGLLKLIEKHTELSGYEVDPFRFIYISKEDTTTPLIYEMPNEFGELAMNGWKNYSGYAVKGIRQLCKELQWYSSTGNFDLPMDVLINKGLIKINTPIVV